MFMSPQIKLHIDDHAYVVPYQYLISLKHEIFVPHVPMLVLTNLQEKKSITSKSDRKTEISLSRE
jgi:hypothetical protein